MFLLRFGYGETSERPPGRSLARRWVGRFLFLSPVVCLPYFSLKGSHLRAVS